MPQLWFALPGFADAFSKLKTRLSCKVLFLYGLNVNLNVFYILSQTAGWTVKISLSILLRQTITHCHLWVRK